MPAHFRAFRDAGNYSAGVFLIPQSLDIGAAIDELVLIWLASEASGLGLQAGVAPAMKVHRQGARRDPRRNGNS